MNSREVYALYRKSKGVSIDTRSIKKGELFFALVTDKNDGHSYLEVAFQKGAIGAVVSCLEKVPNQYYDKVVVVSDTKQALLDTASYHRSQLVIPVIAVSGSNGKTTTKELLSAVLAKKYRVCATKANENNDLGVSLTLLGISEKKHDIAVVELGTNHSGEMKLLCDIARPSHGVLTSFGKEHLEGFGNMKGVIKEEMVLVENLSSNGGVLFWNRDIVEVSEQKIRSYSNITVHGFAGKKKDSLVRVQQVLARFPELRLRLAEEAREYTVVSQLAGSWNVGNILAALSIGLYFGVPLRDRVAAIKAYVPASMRAETFLWKGRRVFLDAYNANPTSMELVWKDVSKIEGNTICIIGGMREMGKYEKKEHGVLVDLIQKLKLKQCFFVGLEWKPFVKKIISNQHQYFEDASLCKEFLEHNLPPKNSLIVLKASKGIHLWEIVDKKFI